MNELYELVLGVGRYFGKFFKNALSEGGFYVHFPSCRSYFQLCEMNGGGLMGFSSIFMNYMKIYEGGNFKRFFWKGASFSRFGMKLDEGRSSCFFIRGADVPEGTPDADMMMGYWDRFSTSDGVEYARAMATKVGGWSREERAAAEAELRLVRWVGLAVAVLVGVVVACAFGGV